MPDTSAPASVTITLDGKPYTLIPTFERMKVVNRLYGGLTALFRAVADLDGDKMTLIIAAGAGIRGKPVEALARDVYEAGVENLIEPVTQFLSLCARGGRAPAPAPADGLTEEQGKAEPAADRTKTGSVNDLVAQSVPGADPTHIAAAVRAHDDARTAGAGADEAATRAVGAALKAGAPESVAKDIASAITWPAAADPALH